MFSTLRHWSTHAFVRKSAVATIDQAVLSAGGFATAVLLAIHCPKPEFGLYVFVFTFQLLAGGLAGSFVTRPLNVLGPTMAREKFQGYVASVALCQVGVGGLTAIALFAAAVVGVAFDWWPQAFGALSWAAAVAFVAQGREFVRQVMFTRLRPGGVLVNDVINTGGVLVAVLCVAFSGGLDAAAVFRWTALISSVTLAIGLWQIRGQIDRSRLDLTDAIQRNVAYGRWAAAVTLSTFACMQLPVLIFPAFTGLAGLAAVEAARHALAPIMIFRTAAGNLFMPRAAGVFAESGRDGLHTFLFRSLGVVGVLIAAYGALVALAPEWTLSLLYGDKFAGAGAYVRLWAFVLAVSHISFAASIGLEAMRRPDAVCRVAIGSAVCFLGTLAVFVPWLGERGVILAWGTTEVARAAVLLTIYVRPGVERRPVVQWGT